MLQEENILVIESNFWEINIFLDSQINITFTFY